MVGITAFGAYIPVNRLPHRQLGGGRGERAVAGHDEDSVTMAVAAALDCLGGQAGPHRPDLVYHASTTAPYREKQAAATLAGALALDDHVRSADFADSLRAGAAAMLAALDAVAGGGVQTALVTAADCRLGAPGGSSEAAFGDAAAAFLFGREHVLAELRASHSVTADFTGNWRTPGDRFVQNWEERFIVGEGYVPLVTAAVRGVLEKANLGPGDCARLVLAAPGPRHHAALAQALGFAPDQVQDPLLTRVGSPGAAHAPLMLAAALEAAAPGQYVLLATFGEGADAILFQVTDGLREFAPRRGVAGHLTRRREIPYQRYLRWRNLVPGEAPRRPPRPRPSQPAAWRNRRRNLAFQGVHCTVCRTPLFPPQRVCPVCQSLDQFTPYGFAHRTGRVTTFTADYLAASADPPNLLAMVDFDGGGRVLMDMADCDQEALTMGMAVEPVFRCLGEADGLRVYFWKASPAAPVEVTQ